MSRRPLATGLVALVLAIAACGDRPAEKDLARCAVGLWSYFEEPMECPAYIFHDDPLYTLKDCQFYGVEVLLQSGEAQTALTAWSDSMRQIRTNAVFGGGRWRTEPGSTLLYLAPSDRDKAETETVTYRDVTCTDERIETHTILTFYRFSDELSERIRRSFAHLQQIIDY